MSTMTISGGSAWNVAAGGGTGGVEGHHHHGGGRMLDDAAKALGMSKQDVVSALRSGKSLDDLAADQGMSHDDLVTALKANMPQRLQSSDQADAIAERMATTKGLDALRPQRGGPQGPGGTPPAPPTTGDGDGDGDDKSTGALGARLTENQEKTLGALASLLGTDSSSLLTSLKSGTSLSDLVQSKGVDSGALAGVLQNGLLYDAKA